MTEANFEKYGAEFSDITFKSTFFETCSAHLETLLHCQAAMRTLYYAVIKLLSTDPYSMEGLTTRDFQYAEPHSNKVRSYKMQ